MIRTACVVICLSAALGGCDTPSPHLLHIEPVEVAHGGATFLVYADAREMQIIRKGSILGIDPQVLIDDFQWVAASATDCLLSRPRRFQGSVISYDLTCR